MSYNFTLLEDFTQICDQQLCWSELEHSRVLITGATGMIPSYLAMTLLHYRQTHVQSDLDITILVRNTQRARRLFAPYLERVWFHIQEGDVCTWTTEESFDFIIHGASPADPRSFGANPAGVFLSNVQGTWSLLELARKSRAKGFVFLSSGESQGQLLAHQRLVNEHTFGTSDPMDARSCYSEGKRAGEALCAIWRRQYGVNASVIRISHTYGPTMDITRDSRVFAEFVSDVVHGRNITLKSDGSAVRPFCYLSDAVEGILRVLLAPAPEPCYLLAGKEYLSIRELAELLCGLFPERGLRVVWKERPQGDSYLEAGKQPVCQIDTTRLRALGWIPKVSVREGFLRTVLALEESLRDSK